MMTKSQPRQPGWVNGRLDGRPSWTAGFEGWIGRLAEDLAPEKIWLGSGEGTTGNCTMYPLGLRKTTQTFFS